MISSRTLLLLLGLAALTASALFISVLMPPSAPSSLTSVVEDIEPQEDTPPPALIVATIVSHNEDTLSPQYPDFSTDDAALAEQRDAVAAFAATVTEHGAAYDFQTDWNFLLGLQTHGAKSAATNGENLLAYLTSLGVSVDPHSHEHLGYTYADVAYLISTFGVTPTGIVGGFIASPAAASQLEYLWETIQGSRYSSPWTPTAGWGGGTALHQNETDLWMSGIWRPTSNAAFATHDPNAPLPVIGRYNSDWTGLDRLLELQAAGELEPGKIYTVSIMTNQTQFDDAYTALVAQKIDEYADDVLEGRMTWMTLPDLLTLWQTTYDEAPSQLLWDGDETASELSPRSATSSSTKPLRDLAR